MLGARGCIWHPSVYCGLQGRRERKGVIVLRTSVYTLTVLQNLFTSLSFPFLFFPFFRLRVTTCYLLPNHTITTPTFSSVILVRLISDTRSSVHTTLLFAFCILHSPLYVLYLSQTPTHQTSGHQIPIAHRHRYRHPDTNTNISREYTIFIPTQSERFIGSTYPSKQPAPHNYYS